MKLTVLVENNTYIDQYYLGEPALSFLLEEDGKRFLFDAGYSDVFLENTKRMGIPLAPLDAVILSHSHNDHTGGLAHLSFLPKQTPLIAHPAALLPTQYEGMEIGSPLPAKELEKRFCLQLQKEPLFLTEHLAFLGEIPVTCDFESRYAIGAHGAEADYLWDDTALAYDTPEGIFIITACSHSGVCNIMEQAKKVFGKDRIAGVIGGFHLFEADARLDATIDYFEKNRIAALYPCHCVSFAAKAAIHRCIPIHEVATGMVLELSPAKEK